jgi:PAS domain S-box-containing protein
LSNGSREHQDASLASLRKSEALFRSLFESSGEAIMVRRPDRTLLMANPAAIDLFGCKDQKELGELLPHRLSPAFQPDGMRSDDKAQLLTEAALCGEKQSFSWEYRLRNGQVLYATVLLTRLDIDGESFLQVIIHDVTKQKQVEQELFASQAKYKTLYESSSDAIALIEPGGHFLGGNRAAIALFGFRDEAEMLSCSPIDVSPERQPDGAPSNEKIAQNAELAVRQNSCLFEWRYRRRDGTEFPATVLLNPMEIGGRLIIQATVRDITEQVLAEKSRCARERQLRLFGDNVSDIIWHTDLQGNFQYISPSIEPLLGWKWHDGMKLSISDLIMPSSEQTAQESLQSIAIAAQGGQRIKVSDEIELRRSDGSGVLTEINASGLYGESGELVGFVGVTRDITQRKLTEQKLSASERRYRLLAENLNDVIWTMDLEGRLTYFSPSVQRLLGYQWKDNRDFRMECVLTPQSLAIARSVLNELLAAAREGKPIETKVLELEQIRKDGSTVWTEISVNGMYDELGHIIGVQGVTRDIDHRRRLETALRDNQQKLQAILDQTYEFIGVLSLDGILKEANRAALAFAKIDESTVLDRPFWETPWWSHSPELQQELRHWITEAASGTFIRKEVTHPDAEGALHWVDFSLKPVRNVAGEVAFIIPEGRDITDRKQMEDELRKAKEAAENATLAKSRFLASMSHEIRTPMTAILGYADLLMDPLANPDAQKNYASVIRRNGEHLLTLINDILDLSKIEAGKMTIALRRCSVVAILADVGSVVRPRAEQHGISVTVEYSGEMPETVLTDGDRLRQAVINLAGNAVKFTDSGGVRIVGSFLGQWRDNQPAVRIDVIDTGIGIRAEVLPHLFQPFGQGDVSRKFGGTGLGLAISRQIAQMLGGELNVASVFGEGSKFTLIVPTGNLDGIAMLQRPAETILDAPVHKLQSQTTILDGVRVLLAEDGYDNRELIEMVLGRGGATIASVENGRLAVERALTGTFDVILMDINMPEMDGLEATRMLRKSGYDRPILALTANAMTGDADKCREAGCNEHLSKPIDRLQLIHTVAKYAGRQTQEYQEQVVPLPATVMPNDDEALISQFVDDPDIVGVLKGFITRLENQIDAMHQAFVNGRFEELQRHAHKLMGAAGSYGYPTLTSTAKVLEDAASSQDAMAVGAALDDLDRLAHAIEKGNNRSEPTARSSS